ncbi:MAG: amidohydrolase [Proteobacteria bacterium]|nr:amidohydrolase [Pseudomonadota bacterium]
MKDRLVKFRREIHMNPELSGNEKDTAAFIAGILEANDIEVKRGVGGHGVVGILRGRLEGKTIALRADMDALPIQDKKDVDYASKVPGVMHACGHDVHTTVLLGAAITLGSVRERLKGSVKFIFQPAEEITTGAESMIKEGVLEDPVPSAIVALHCFPELQVGTVGHRPGMMTAAADRIKIVVNGRSGHASRPHQTVDAVLVSSMMINALHHIVSRRTDPLQPSVISIGTIKGGTAENIVADHVEMEGTVRTLDLKLRERMPTLIEDVVKGIAGAMGAKYKFSYSFDCPSVSNDKEVDNLVSQCASQVIGDDKVILLNEPMMGSEDFALFTEKIPGALFRLGTGNADNGITSSLHNSSFDVDEESLFVGTELMAWIAVNYLES